MAGYDIYQAMAPFVTDTGYYEAPPMSKFVMVGPGIVAPNDTTERMNGLGKKAARRGSEDDEEATHVYLSAPKAMTKGRGTALAGQGKHGRGIRLAGEGKRRTR